MFLHLQHAARYLRGLGDGIPSHATVPMLSSLLLSSVKECMRDEDLEEDVSDEEDAVEEEEAHIENPNAEEELKDVHICVATDEDAGMCFYKFCCCVRLQTKARSKDVKNTHETHLGVLQRHALQDQHPLAQSHELLEHTNEARGEGAHKFVPRVVGMGIPHNTDSKKWKLFALTHFKPFSIAVPLIPLHSSVDVVYASYNFSAHSLAIMKHWEAVHKCEDERDADWLQKRAQLTTGKKDASRLLVELDNDVDVTPANPFCKSAQEELKMNQFIILLKQSQWLVDVNESPPKVLDISTVIDAQDVLNMQYDLLHTDCSPYQLKRWSVEIRNPENAITDTRHNALNPDNQEEVASTVKATSVSDSSSKPSFPIPPTQCTPPPAEPLSSAAVIQQIGEQFQLNEKQWIAFGIIAEHFVQKFVEKRSDTSLQLTMLMIGPGGTGKMHIVKAV
ncbi:hypothetical protein BDR05DRAFT_1005149 [Suillus weaverae]|nr:hypothetical protein BDR05DRAFT_1005149 [Suillus weaverae]